METGVDHFESGIAQGSGDHLGPAIVTVEAGLGDEDPSGHAGPEGY